MYSEIYDGMMDILNRDPSEKLLTEMRDTGHFPHFLAMSFDFDPQKILRVKRVKVANGPDIVFVLAFSPDETPDGRYVDYIVMDGEICKVILLNMNLLTSEDLSKQTFTIAWAVYNACLGIAENYKSIIDTEGSSPYSINTMVYYAPAVIIIQLFRKLFKDQPDGDMYIQTTAAIMMYSRANPTPDTISSICRAIDDTSLTELLDCSYLLTLDRDVYPGALFADETEDEEEEEDDE